MQMDGDGFAGPLMTIWSEVDADETHEIYYTLDPTIDGLVEAYYILLRPLISFQVPLFSGEAGQEIIDIWHLALWVAACRFAAFHLRFDQPVTPDWARRFDAEVREALSARAPGVNSVSLGVTVAPELAATARDAQHIVISLFTREIFKEFSTAIWNCLFILGDEAPLRGRPDIVLSNATRRRPFVQWLGRAIVPYLVYITQHVHRSRLPVTSSVSQAAAICALATSELQTKFVLAHEYGHVSLGHLSDSGAPLETITARETEASRFGLEWAFDSAEHEHQGDVWTALRWLCMFQHLDRLVANLLVGERASLNAAGVLSWEPVLASFKPTNLAADDGYEKVGTLLLSELGESLIAKGSIWIRALARTLARPANVGPVPNWWLEL